MLIGILHEKESFLRILIIDEQYVLFGIYYQKDNLVFGLNSVFIKLHKSCKHFTSVLLHTLWIKSLLKSNEVPFSTAGCTKQDIERFPTMSKGENDIHYSIMRLSCTLKFNTIPYFILLFKLMGIDIWRLYSLNAFTLIQYYSVTRITHLCHFITGQYMSRISFFVNVTKAVTDKCILIKGPCF